MNDEVVGKKILIRGIVQGVGFRPFIYSQAKQYGLTGWIRNTTFGVEIEVNGKQEGLDSFLASLKSPPVLARIDETNVISCNPNGYTKFEIISSSNELGEFIPVSPDVSICPDCLRELFDPSNRRFRYPFINCTNCGPRFTIIRDTPYDRPNTTMADFTMCKDCQAEYSDPLNRRFHAQPIACQQCGPQVWFESENKQLAQSEDAIQLARQWLMAGKIIGIKGLGGFHLACDATNRNAVMELRARKHRSEKPFAVMVFDLSHAERHVMLSDQEKEIITSKEKPILLAAQKKGSSIDLHVAPGLINLGIMLPYTPLHYLLLEPSSDFPEALVMTSGNISEEPIAFTNHQALEKLSSLADGFLLHNREIQTRLDDSVVMHIENRIYPIRRARSYAPDPVLLSSKTPEILAVGAGLKNTFCLTREKYAFISHHIGDLENLETLTSFEDAIDYYEKLFRIKPQSIVCDLHPDYLSTQYAVNKSQELKIPLIRVQHHHAHLSACLADNQFESPDPVIGVCFDGSGLGTDGAIWGGEFLLGNYKEYERMYHLKYVPLPGGDQAIRHPSWMAFAHLYDAGIELTSELAPAQSITSDGLFNLKKILEGKLNTYLTSSIGRLFDAAAALIGIHQVINYEAQAAIELEAICDLDEKGFYLFKIENTSIDPQPLWMALINDILDKKHQALLAARFHNSIVEMVINVCKKIRFESGSQIVALSGGVWQNRLLLGRTIERLKSDGFNVLWHTHVPANDGGVSLGQAMIAATALIQ